MKSDVETLDVTDLRPLVGFLTAGGESFSPSMTSGRRFLSSLVASGSRDRIESTKSIDICGRIVHPPMMRPLALNVHTTEVLAKGVTPSSVSQATEGVNKRLIYLVTTTLRKDMI